MLKAIMNQNPSVNRLKLTNLIEADVDWNQLEQGISGELAKNPKKEQRQHQKEAMDLAHAYFKDNGRGKLIMASGTGKTFTSPRISENESEGKGLILLKVTSIAMLGQTLSGDISIIFFQLSLIATFE